MPHKQSLAERVKPIFVLGVGAQKAGTTWLSRYLSSFPFVDRGIVKEYHIWDAKFNPDGIFDSFVMSARNTDTNPGKKIIFSMQNVEGFYEDYFAGLIRGDVRLTADISPSYCALPASIFSEIRDRMTGKGFDVRVVFMMRDPAERCWSAAKMKTAVLYPSETTHFASKARKIFSEFMADRRFEIRTRYEVTVNNLREAFPEEKIYFGIFEEMFEEQHIGSLSRFLSVPTVNEFLNERHNASRELPIDPDLAAQCVEYYRSTYEFCDQHFPQTKRLWRRP